MSQIQELKMPKIDRFKKRTSLGLNDVVSQVKF